MLPVVPEGKFSELRDHHHSIPRQNLPQEPKFEEKRRRKKKVATPYLHGASAIRRPRRRPDALNVILRLNRCLDGMR